MNPTPNIGHTQYRYSAAKEKINYSVNKIFIIQRDYLQSSLLYFINQQMIYYSILVDCEYNSRILPITIIFLSMLPFDAKRHRMGILMPSISS